MRQWLVIGVDITGKLQLVKRCNDHADAEKVARLEQSTTYRIKFVVEGEFYAPE